MTDEEIRAVAELVQHSREDLDKRRKRAPSTTGEEKMQLELKILAGAESKAFLADFAKQVDRLEKLTGGKGLKPTDKNEISDEDEDDAKDEETDEDDDFAPKKASKKGSSFDEDDADAEEAPPAKTKKKKLTVNDVNDACKKRAASVGGKAGRDEVLKILKKKFKVESVADLEPEQYADAIEAVAVDE